MLECFCRTDIFLLFSFPVISFIWVDFNIYQQGLPKVDIQGILSDHFSVKITVLGKVER